MFSSIGYAQKPSSIRARKTSPGSKSKVKLGSSFWRKERKFFSRIIYNLNKPQTLNSVSLENVILAQISTSHLLLNRLRSWNGEENIRRGIWQLRTLIQVVFFFFLTITKKYQCFVENQTEVALLILLKIWVQGALLIYCIRRTRRLSSEQPYYENSVVTNIYLPL